MLRGISGRLYCYSKKMFEFNQLILSKKLGQFETIKFNQYKWRIPWIVRHFLGYLVICGLNEMCQVGSATCG